MEKFKRQKWKALWRTLKKPVLWATSLIITVLILVYLQESEPRFFYYLRYPLTAISIVALIGFILSLIRLGYRYKWTGFGQDDIPRTETKETRPRKTLWDWMQLLIIPVVLAAGAAWFNWSQQNNQEQVEEQRSQDDALQEYLDQMGTLVIDKNLGTGTEEEPEEPGASAVARARTLTVLAQVDSDRKGTVVEFLHEAGLIQKGQPEISLADADLRAASLSYTILANDDLSNAHLTRANFSRADLSGANLKETDLIGANLSNANLKEADLSGFVLLNYADLTFANLQEADLSDAMLWDADLSYVDLTGATTSAEQLEECEVRCKSLKGATMPDGSKHG